MTTPSAESIVAALSRAIGSALASPDPNLAPLDPSLDGLLFQLRRYLEDGSGSPTGLIGWLEALEGSAAGWEALQAWQSALRDLPNVPLSIDAILVRLVEFHAPRLAALLGFTGVFDVERDAAGRPNFVQPRINWPAAYRLLTDPAYFFSPAFLDSMFPGDVWAARAFAALAGTALAAPGVARAVREDSIGLAPLAPVTVRDPAATPRWQAYREATTNWFALTLPLPIEYFSSDTDFGVRERVVFNLHPDIQPASSLTLAIRGVTESANGDTHRNFEIWLAFHADAGPLDQFLETAYPLGGGWELQLKPALGIQQGFGLGIGRINGETEFTARLLEGGLLDTGPASALELGLRRMPRKGQPALLFGPAGGSHVSVDNLGLTVRLRMQPPYFEVGADVKKLTVVLTTQFLSIFGAGSLFDAGGLRLALDVGTTYVQGKGLEVQAGSSAPSENGTGASQPPLFGLDRTLVVNKQLGSDSLNLTIRHVRLRAEGRINGQNSLDGRVAVLFTASARLGPLLAVMSEGGAWLGSWSDNGSTSYAGLVPPRGIGISLDAEGISGGGFLERLGEDHYRGAMQLQIRSFAVTAYGIYQKTPQGRTSLVAVLGVRFPGVQVGFGFTLNGIGGVIGINRRADVDLMRQRLTSGATGNVLFSENPVQDAPTILGDVNRFFPMADGRYVLGPTAQLRWLDIVRFDLGVLIELPGPSKIVVLGTVRAVVEGISPDRPLVSIRLDIAGVIDFQKKLVAFDATLINSHVLGIMTLTGDAAFRLSWGSRPYILLSVGGFHPAFNPQPVAFPTLARATAVYQSTSGIKVWLRQEMYFAFTSNTLQLGGRNEAGFELGPIRGEGFFGFDVLIQFTPFYFQFDFAAGFSIKYKSHSLASVHVEGTVSGPGPVRLRVRFAFKVLFIKIEKDKTFELGSPGADPVRLPNISGTMSAALHDNANLAAIGAEDGEVILAGGRASVNGVLASPAGGVAWTQKAAPLDVSLERFEGAPLPAAHRLRVQSSTGSSPARDWFSPGSYLDLSSSESLNNDAFQYLQSGVVLHGAAPLRSSAVAVPANQINVITIPDWQSDSGTAQPYASPGLAQAIAERDGQLNVPPGTPAVTVREEVWHAYGATGELLEGQLSPIEAFLQARRRHRGLALPARDEAINVSRL
jgi:hypothetical protein